MTPQPLQALPSDRPWTVAEAIVYLRMENLKHAHKIIVRRVRAGKIKAGRNGRDLLFTKQQLDASIGLK